MTDPTERLREEIHDEQVGEVQKAAERTARRATRRMLVRWAPPIAASVALTVASLTAVALGPLYSQQNQTTTALAEVRKLAEGAKTAGELANTQLKDRGQATVPIPQPSDNSNSDVLVASATARVLASLPDTRPTTAQLGEAVARYVASNPSAVGPSPQQIAASLAGYLATNPPAPGKNGADGPPGRPPTAEEIAAAVHAYCNPAGQPSPCRGPQGDVGAKGDAGRGVQHSEVVDCRWRVTYTDGTTEDAGNACTTQTQTKTVTPTPSPTTPAPLIPTP